MDFLLTESQRDLKRSIRDFVDKIRPFIKEPDRRGDRLERLTKKIAEKWPEAMFKPSGDSDPDLSCLDYVVILEEISKAVPDWRLVLAVHKTLGLKRFLGSGLMDRKENQLPPLGMAAFALGVAACALEQGLRAVHKKEWQRRSAMKIEAVRLAIAEGLAELETARLQMYRAAFLEDRGKSSLEESAAAGAFARELAVKATSMISLARSKPRFNLGKLKP